MPCSAVVTRSWRYWPIRSQARDRGSVGHPGQGKLVQGGTGAGAGQDAGVVAVVFAGLRVGGRVEPFRGRGERDVVQDKPQGLAGLQPFVP